jgi:Tol biopolymer transport system component
LYVGSVQYRYEFLRYDLKSGQLVPAFGGLSGTNLEFSRDGKWVVYVSVPDGSLWRSAVDGSQRLVLTSPPMRAELPHWSPDGKQIAFMGIHIHIAPESVFTISRNAYSHAPEYTIWDRSCRRQQSDHICGPGV